MKVHEGMQPVPDREPVPGNRFHRFPGVHTGNRCGNRFPPNRFPPVPRTANSPLTPASTTTGVTTQRDHRGRP